MPSGCTRAIRSLFLEWQDICGRVDEFRRKQLGSLQVDSSFLAYFAGDAFVLHRCGEARAGKRATSREMHPAATNSTVARCTKIRLARRMAESIRLKAARR